MLNLYGKKHFFDFVYTGNGRPKTFQLRKSRKQL